MERHLTMKLTLSPTSMVSFTNMPWVPPEVSGASHPQIMVFHSTHHGKLGHRGIKRTCHLINWQYYWKDMNKDICKYIANCTLHKKEKAKMQIYPLQMTDIPDWPFDKKAIDLIIDLNISTSGNQHILTIIDHLMGWPEAFSIPDKKADTIVHVFNQQLSPCLHVSQIHTVWLCNRIQEPTNGWCTQATWHQSHLFHSL